MQHSLIKKRIFARISSFLVNEISIPPLLYFLAFLYLHLPLEARYRSDDLIFFLVAVAAAILCNFNFIFTLAPFVQQHIAIALAMFLLGLFSCTQKWKIYIFLLSIGDQLFQEDFSKSYFLAIFSLLICLETYRSLIFKSIADNIQYFVGMAVISLYYSLHIVIKSYQLPIDDWMVAILLFTTASFAMAVIEHRIARLRKMEPERIYLERQLAHFLRMAEGDIRQPYVSQMKVVMHCRNCEKLHCFCRNPEYRGRSEYLMRQLYENAIRKYDRKRDSLLIEYYIDFLLLNKQAINALHFLAQWQPENYFDLVCHWRARAKIDKQLANQNSSNIYQKEYAYALEYDQHSLSVAIEINKILKLKLRFWNEINRESPRVANLQKMGHEIIALMHGLNSFYNRVIKTYEQKIFVFDSTVLYAMYMLSTTNFKEYAELIIKNTAKLLQEVYIFENSASETFAIRTVVKNQAKSLSECHRTNLQPITSPNLQSKGCSRHHLVIDAVSNGLCKILHMSKSGMLDNQLKIIIPDGYREVHDIRLNYLLDFESQVVGRVIPSRILHRQIKLPIKAANGELMMGYVCIKYQLDVEDGLTFITIVKLIRDRSSNLLMDFSGNITEIQEGFNLQIIKHSQVKKYLNKLRSSWISQRTIRQQKFNLMVNAANYVITISAPFTQLFTEKQQLKDRCPPIHIQVLNQETVKNRNIEGDKNNKVGRQIKHMQSALQNYDSQSSNTSAKGGTSAVNILSIFSQNNTVPLYRFLYITFVAIITCCIISNIGAYFVTQLPWDNTLPTNNPLNDTMNFNALQMLTVKTVITLQDQVLYFKQRHNFNTTRISQYFGFDNYEVSVVNFTQQLLFAFQSNIFNILGTPSDFMAEEITKKLESLVTIDNPDGFSNQTMTYLQLLMVYVTDLSLLTQLQLSSTVIADTYSPTIYYLQNCSTFSTLIDNGVATAQTTSIAVHISLMAVMTILLIPLFYLLRNRLSLHQKIFDLLASIDPSQVTKQIKSLQYVCNILRNYKESNQIMKMNVLDYEENMIHPKRDRERRSSVDNDLVLGLERYDVSHEEEEVRVSKQSVESFKISMIKSKSNRGFRASQICSQIKDQFINTKQSFHFDPRKRAGELDLSGSILDPNSKMIGIHWIVYLISTSFLIFLAFSLSLNLNYNSTYLSQKNQILTIYNRQINFQRYLLTIKVYLTQGASGIQSVFGVSNELDVILPSLFAVPEYIYHNGDTYYSQFNDNCTNGTLPTSNFVQKYCQYSYSQVILRGEFGAIFKELTELRYAIDHNLTVYSDSKTTLLNIKEKFYYLQSLNLRMQELVLDKINLLFQQIIVLTNDYNSNKLLLLLMSVLWGLICFLIGLVIMLTMKEGYFKEVFMITFLNNGMIIKNKRVESFLDSIAKNSYS